MEARLLRQLCPVNKAPWTVIPPPPEVVSTVSVRFLSCVRPQRSFTIPAARHHFIARLIMSEYFLSSFATQISSRLSSIGCTVRRRPLAAGVLAVAGLLLCSPGGARAQTSSLDFDDTEDLEGIGDFIEKVQETRREIRTGGFLKQQRGLTELKRLAYLPFTLLTRDYVTIALPTSDPNVGSRFAPQSSIDRGSRRTIRLAFNHPTQIRSRGIQS